MTEQATEATETTEQTTTQAVELPDEVKAQLEELDRYKAKHAEAEKHRKAAEQRAKELEEAQAAAEQEALKQSGEFQKLYESESEKAARLQRELEEERASYREKEKMRQQKDIESQAIRDMKNVAVDDSSLELLAEKAQKFAVYTENGIEYQIGGVTVTREKVIETLSEKYPRLVKGSGAAGGGAAGTQRPSGAGEPKNEAAEGAKKKGDLNGYLKAQLNT